MKTRIRRNDIARRLAVTSAALLGTALTPLPALAQSANWSGATGDYTTAPNWTPSIVPTALARFGAVGETNISIAASASIDEIEFNAAAQQYVITNLAGQTYTVNGNGTAGITNLSVFQQFLNNQGTMVINNAARIDGGTAGFNLTNSNPVAGGSATLIFNGTSGMFGTGFLTNFGGGAVANGTTAAGGGATTVFNDGASADGILIQNAGGVGFATAAGATPATATGGSASLVFNDDSHADNATINNIGGGATAAAGMTAAGTATAIGGVATVTFNGNSHADGATISNSDGGATAVGGLDNASGVAVGGVGSITFNDASHADNATINNSGGGGIIALGGAGEPGMPGGNGTVGGAANVIGGLAAVTFTGTAHADGTTINNNGGVVNGLGGAGGIGGTGTGGTGGNGTGTGGIGVISFLGSSHANGAIITNTAATAQGFGGAGGAGGTTGAGGNGGTGTATGGVAVVVFQGDAAANGATFTNTGGNALAVGGLGGNGNGAAGGNGLNGEAIGGGATLSFGGNATLGTGSSIANIGGNGTAIGGNGGNGGAGGAGGNGGGATATGGNATVTFSGNASAGNAAIVNQSGILTSTSGDGGDGDAAAGGNGGTAFAAAGDAAIVFEGSSTAGSATIQNIQVNTLNLALGTQGADGAGGGSGGSTALASGQLGEATITFNGNATGGSARIENIGGTVTFNDDSIFGTAAPAAGQALIENSNNGQVLFNGNASLGNGSAVNAGGGAATNIIFSNNATAATGTITNNGGNVFFADSATAADATIANNNGFVTFAANSTAGNAVITNASVLNFAGDSDAVAARVVNTATGLIQLGGQNGSLRLGSLSGAGEVNLGATIFQVGYLDLDETFAGVIYGAGQVVKRGTGTLVLTGENTYTGTTGIAEGTLQIGDGGTAGSIVGDVINNGNFAFNRSDTITFGGVVSGTGTLTQLGTGALVLTGANTYTGGTIVNAGILQIGDGGTAGSIVGNVLNNANVTFNRSDAVAFAGDMSGTGSVTKIGAGTLILTGTNSYTGLTTVAEGTLQIGGGGTTGSVAGDILNDASLVFNRSDDLVYGGVVSGTGALTKTGTGTLILTGASTYTGLTTIDAGTLQIGNGGTSGAVAGDIVNNAGLAFNRSDAIVYGGIVSGTGTLIQAGTGTLVLTGQNSYTGDTTALAGTLQVDGLITSNTGIAAGATLRGVGMIAGNVGNLGTVSAGNAANPLGTLTVTGAAIFNAGSSLAPTINSAGGTSFLQAGSLTLNGGQVRPTAQAGGLFLMQTDYRIANGTGGIAGTFTGVDESQLPTFLDATLNYVGNDLFLRVRRNATNFAQTAGLTPNQNAISTALDQAVTAANPLVYTTYLTTYNTLLASNGAALQQNLDILSGDALTAVPLVAQGTAERFGDRLATRTWSNSSNIWGLIAYGDQNADGDGNGPGHDANALEFQLGFATSLGANTRLGLSVGMSNGDVDLDGRAARADIDTWSLGAHLRHDFGRVYLAGQLTYNWHSIDTTRALLLGGSATADFDAETWTGSVEAGAVFRTGQFSIEPFVSLRHASTSQDAYGEVGPVGALNVDPADYDTTRLGAGVRLVNRDPAAMVRPHLTVRYERELGDERAALDNDLPGLPAYRVYSTRLGEDVFTAELGVEVQVASGVTLFGTGAGRWRDNENNVQVNGGIRIAF